MAKIKFGMMMTDARGKLGGQVFSKNRSGAYTRTKVTPVNPQSIRQTTVRSQLTALSQAWRGLTEIERVAWNSAVANFTKTDIFGDVKTPSGINLYNAINMNLKQVSIAALVLPPVPSATPEINDITVAASGTASTMTITSTSAPIPANTSWVIEATAQVSPGKYFVKSEYRQILVKAAASTSPINVYAAYTAKFGALTIGQKLFVRVFAVDTLTGIKGQAIAASTIVV